MIAPSAPAHRLHRDVEIGGRDAFALHLHFGGEDLAPAPPGDPPLHRRDMLRISAHRRRVPELLPDRLGRVVGWRQPSRRLLTASTVPSGSSSTITSSAASNTARNCASDAASCAVRSSTCAAKLELRLLGERDVAADADEADQLPVRPEARLRHAAQPAIFAVVAPIASLEREALQRGFAGDALGDDPVDIVGMDPRAPVERPRLLEVQPGPQTNSA